MNCPHCGSRLYVGQTWRGGDGNVRRRRVCPKCSYRVRTIETLEALPDPGTFRYRLIPKNRK